MSFSHDFVRFWCLVVMSQTMSLVALCQVTNRPLRFVGNSKIPPVISLQNGKPVGLAVDLANAVAEKAHLAIRVEAMDWSEAQSLVSGGKADALLQINTSPERERLYDFSDTLLDSHFHIFRKTTRLDIQELTSLYGKKVGVEGGSFPFQYLRRFDQIQLVIVPNWKDGFKMLTQEQLDAVFLDRWVGEYQLCVNQIRGVTVVEPAIVTDDSHIAVRKGNKELLDRINAGLKAITHDGTRQRIFAKWQAKEVVYLTKESVNKIVHFTALGGIALLIVITLRALAHSYTIKKINLELAARTHALTAENEERRRAEAALQEAHDTLEQHVVERTAELKAANASLAESQQAALKLMQDAVTSRIEAEKVNSELATFNAAAVGREMRMIELKQEVNALRTQAGLPERYKLES